MLSTIAGAKLGATIAGIAVGLGGAATVVYVSANVPLSGTHSTASPTTVPAASPTTDAAGTADATETPDPTETAAPTETETPAAEDTSDAAKSPDATVTAVGPDATGPAAHGLCVAWRGITSHGNGQGKALDSVAFSNLAKAAGGADKIAAYCATVAAPGASGKHTASRPSTAPGKPATAPTGKPQSVPTGRPTTRPTGRPTTAPTGRPTTAPTPTSHPTGRH
jgi:hypothetical protein